MISIKRTLQDPTELNETELQFSKEIIGMDTKQAYEYYKKYKHRFKYNTLETKILFKEMNYGRCSFCSMVIKDFNDAMWIEHIKLKKSYPNFIFKWDNLLCSCDICNKKRSTTECDDNQYLDPTKIENVENYFIYEADGTIEANPSLDKTETEKAQYMISLYKLNREDLVYDRRDFYSDLTNFNFDEFIKTVDNFNKHIIFLGLYTYLKKEIT